MTFADGTNQVLALTSSMSAWDQGWGNYDPFANAVVIGLFDGATQVWAERAAQGLRGDQSTQLFDITANPAALVSLNTAMGAIDWSAHPTITMQLHTSGLGYPGWELHVRDASFSVTTAAVPEPESYALLLGGLGVLAFVARRRRS